MKPLNINSSHKGGFLHKVQKRTNLFGILGFIFLLLDGILYGLKDKILSFAPPETFIYCLSRFTDLILHFKVHILLIIVLLLILLVSIQTRYKFKISNILHDQFLKVIWASFLLILFLFSLFPLNWAASFNRSHDSALPYIPFDFILVVIGIMGICSILFFLFLKLPEVLVNIINRITSLFYNCSESLLLVFCLFICFLLTNLFSYFALEHIPHVQDSIAQLFQAKIFKRGALTVPLPSHKEFFDYMNIINQDRWYSQYPPGHSFLLMIGLFFKAPWIINPLLGTLSLILLYFLTKNCYGEKKTSYLSVVFFLLSPFFLFMSASYMNHNSTMFFMLLFIYLYTKTLQSPLWYYSFISGLSLGYAMNIRPLTALVMGSPFLLDSIVHVYKKQKYYLKKMLWFMIGLCLMLITLLIYNYLTNGNPFLFGYQIKHHTLGFLGNAQIGPPHTLKGGFINTSNNLTALNKYLFEWPLPSLLFVFILFLPWIKKNRWDWLFLLSSVLLVVSHFFYYYQDLCFGPRFYFSLAPLLTVLTVRGFLKVPSMLGRFSFNKPKVKATLYLLIFFCFTYTLVFSLPVLFKKYSHFYWHVDNSLHNTLTQRNITNAIVFIDVMVPPGTTIPNLPVYGAGFLYNSPNLDDSVIYALDLGKKNGDLMHEYPKRHCYLWKFNSETEEFKLTKINVDRSREYLKRKNLNTL